MGGGAAGGAGAGAAGGAGAGADGGAGGACDFQAVLDCSDILTRTQGGEPDMSKLCSVFGEYRGCLAAQPNCNTSAQLKTLDDVAKQYNLDLTACDQNTCDFQSVMKCSEIMQAHEGGSQDKDTICRVFGQYKGCLSEQKNCDTSTGLKLLEDSMKEIGIDLNTCSSAGMVQVSIACVLLALIASFFTR
ncbi:uncharacterized protein [Haliotis cracherodii]|uniref:uncharacterized protein n=1 Tax=Haliotis cracherodii TaxID=6455 RepID=UPI0039E8F928